MPESQEPNVIEVGDYTITVRFYPPSEDNRCPCWDGLPCDTPVESPLTPPA